jgi:Zn-dependent peptidase ImmA (M78 family)
MKGNNPAALAAQLIANYCYENPKQLNVEELAFAENLIIKESDSKNFYGRLMYNANAGIITVNKIISDTGARRFTVAHEIGHFFNERNLKLTEPAEYNKSREYLFRCVENDFTNANKIKRREANANEFAAELLMHRPWFNAFIIKREINFELIKEIANYFSVSLSAAAFRYVNIGKYPAAVIYSKDGIVKWNAFHDYFPFKFLPKGLKVPKESAAFDFFAGRTMQTEYDLVPAKAWFSNDFNCKATTYLYEQNVAMASYNAVLTLLWESEFK